MTTQDLIRSLRLALVAVVLTFVAGTAAPASAQNAGLVLGVTSSTVSMGPSPSASAVAPTLSRYSGAIMGGFLSTSLKRRVSLDVEGVYIVRGIKLQTATALSADRLSYLAAPVLARAVLGQMGPVSVHVVAGPSFGFRIGASDIANNIGLGNEVTRFDLGLVVGGGIQFRTYILEVRYEQGLTNIAQNGGLLGTGTMKNRTIAVLGMLPL
jgi:Outer membrane protein beta-barrel domain